MKYLIMYLIKYFNGVVVGAVLRARATINFLNCNVQGTLAWTEVQQLAYQV